MKIMIENYPIKFIKTILIFILILIYVIQEDYCLKYNYNHKNANNGIY